MEIISARDDDAVVMLSSNRPTTPKSAPLLTGNSTSFTERHSMPGAINQWLHTSPVAKAQSYEGDFANLISTGGHIIVGYVGEDKKDTDGPGMWKKLVSFFTGGSSAT